MNFHLKTTIRNLSKKPIYSLITFVGFTFGIAAGLLIYLWVFSELNYDKSHQNYERIYRVLTLSKQGNEIVKSAGCYRPVAATLKKDYPQIEYATFLSYSSEDSPLQSKEGGEKIEAREVWVSDDFFSIFNGFTFIEGNAFDAIKNPSAIILTETVAKKLFGSEHALGKTVVSEKYSTKVYTVEGVVNIPQDSHIDFGYILPQNNPTVANYSNNWSDKSHVHVYIKLKKDAQIDDAFLSRISNQIGRYSKITDKLLFQPIADIHLRSDYEPNIYDKNTGNYKYVWIFSGLAMLIILMATFNFSVLSVARASERSTEIGIKKVNGAGRMHIIKQFMGESLIQTLAAALLSVVILWLFMPWVSAISGKELHLTLSLKLIINLLLLTLGTGILAGAYPSFFLSALSPTNIFRGKSITGSGTGFIRLLVAVQFSIAIFFIIATTLFVKQLDYIRSKDLGMNHQNIVVIPTGLWYNNKGFKEELLKNPSILGVSASVFAPVDFEYKTTLALNHQGVVDSLNASLFWVDEDFAKTYQLEIVKGQFLQMDYSAYWKQLHDANKEKNKGKEYMFSTPVVINETAERMMRFPDPIGQRIGDKVIVGVVKDFHFRPLRCQIEPIVLENNPETIGTMNVKIAAGNRSKTLKYICDVYGKYRDQRNLSYSFFDDLLNEKYKEEIRLKNITIAFSFLAILISVLGILGMAVFSIDRRTKEIGIRKINGAKVSEVMVMINRDFVKWIAIAFVIATPLAWFVLHKWLENFAYKTELSWWIFALAGVLALAIALITVSWQSWKAATRNPVEALRYE
jgi:putative ABC transport system permease protein